MMCSAIIGGVASYQKLRLATLAFALAILIDRGIRFINRVRCHSISPFVDLRYHDDFSGAFFASSPAFRCDLPITGNFGEGVVQGRSDRKTSQLFDCPRIIAIIAAIVLNKTKIGRYNIFAIGSNKEATAYLGLTSLNEAILCHQWSLRRSSRDCLCSDLFYYLAVPGTDGT